jgi:hypothetical protein
MRKPEGDQAEVCFRRSAGIRARRRERLKCAGSGHSRGCRVNPRLRPLWTFDPVEKSRFSRNTRLRLLLGHPRLAQTFAYGVSQLLLLSAPCSPRGCGRESGGRVIPHVSPPGGQPRRVHVGHGAVISLNIATKKSGSFGVVHDAQARIGEDQDFVEHSAAVTDFTNQVVERSGRQGTLLAEIARHHVAKQELGRTACLVQVPLDA